MAIERFRGKDYYLSSMYPLKNGVVLPDGREVSCVEIAYCADRFVNREDREDVIAAEDGFEAKSITKRLEKAGHPVDPGWKVGKLAVMRVYVAQKFERHPELAEQLIATGDEPIYEGNPWRDTYWGVSPVGSRNGQNHLGRLLMEERALIQRSHEPVVQQDPLTKI